MTKYQVIAPCITHIPVPGVGGTSLDTLYQGAILPDGVPQDRIKHLLDTGLIVEVGADAQPVGVGTQDPPVTTPDQPDKVSGGPAKVAPPPGKKNDPPAKR